MKYVLLFCSFEMQQAMKITQPKIVKGMGNVDDFRVYSSTTVVILRGWHT